MTTPTHDPLYAAPEKTSRRRLPWAFAILSLLVGFAVPSAMLSAIFLGAQQDLIRDGSEPLVNTYAIGGAAPGEVMQQYVGMFGLIVAVVVAFKCYCRFGLGLKVRDRKQISRNRRYVMLGIVLSAPLAAGLSIWQLQIHGVYNPYWVTETLAQAYLIDMLIGTAFVLIAARIAWHVGTTDGKEDGKLRDLGDPLPSTPLGIDDKTWDAMVEHALKHVDDDTETTHRAGPGWAPTQNPSTNVSANAGLGAPDHVFVRRPGTPSWTPTPGVIGCDDVTDSLREADVPPSPEVAAFAEAHDTAG